MKRKHREYVSRRTFLRTALAASVAPYIIPGRALGLEGPAPSERITIGCIGVNGMGTSDMRSFLELDDAQVVAVCDVDVAHRERAQKIVEDHYAAKTASTYKGCAVYNDFREVLARPDIDAVCIGTPDHWHVVLSIAAAKAGKDIYCEKPLSRTVAEGRALVNVMDQYGRVFQTGTQLRSMHANRYACELVRNGRIGKLHTIRTYLPTGPDYGLQPAMPVPKGFDYDLWLGPAPEAPYTEKRCHFNFRYISDYAGGPMTDLGAHDNDLAQWGHGTEYTGPVEVEGQGQYPQNSLFDTAMKFTVRYKYADGVELICSTDPCPNGGTGVRFEGSDGWVFTRWNCDAEPKSLLTSKIGPNEIHLYESINHQQNFLDCIRTRAKTIAAPEIAHRSATICHIGNIAMRLGRKLQWDPENERFVNDEDANRYLSLPLRAPWTV